MSQSIVKNPIRFPTSRQTTINRRRLTMRIPTYDEVADPSKRFFALPPDVFRVLLNLLCDGATSSPTLPGLAVLANLASTCWFFRLLLAEHRTSVDIDDFRPLYETPLSRSFSMASCITTDGRRAGARVNCMLEHDNSGRIVPICPAHITLLRERRGRYARPVHLVLVFAGSTTQERKRDLRGVKLNVRDAVRLLGGVAEASVARLDGNNSLFAPRVALSARLRVPLGPLASLEQRRLHSLVGFANVELAVSGDGHGIVRKMVLSAKLDDHHTSRFVVAVPSQLTKLLGGLEPVHVACVPTMSDYFVSPCEVAEDLRSLDRRTQTPVPKGKAKKTKRKWEDKGAIDVVNVLAGGRRREASYSADAAIRVAARRENASSSASEDDEPVAPIAARRRRLLM
jgi:hypothetical protein